MRTHGGNVWQGRAPEDWLDFSANLRPDGAPEWVRAALRDAIDRTQYYPDPTMRAARAALGGYLGIDPAWALPTAGGISAIGLVTRLPAEGMLVFAPCFGEYARAAEQQGVALEFVSLLDGNRNLLRPSEALEEFDVANRAVWLCTPLNPVGIAFPRREIASLLARIEAEKGWLVLDEAFIHCSPEYSSIELLAEHSRLLITGSLTKSLGIPGVRLGYLCAQPDLLRTLAEHQNTWELSCFAEAVLCALPEHARELHVEAEQNARRREALRGELERLGARVYPSNANFLLADFGRDVAPIAARLKERGILVRTCMDFAKMNDGQHLRLAVKDEFANARLIAELARILNSDQ